MDSVIIAIIKEILQKLSNEHTSQVNKAAAKKFREVSKLFMMHQPNFKPKVYTKIEERTLNKRFQVVDDEKNINYDNFRIMRVNDTGINIYCEFE